MNEQVAAEQSLTAKGSRGQPTVSPLVRAQSELSATLAQLLESLALPSPDEEEGDLSMPIDERLLTLWAFECSSRVWE